MALARSRTVQTYDGHSLERLGAGRLNCDAPRFKPPLFAVTRSSPFRDDMVDSRVLVDAAHSEDFQVYPGGSTTLSRSDSFGLIALNDTDGDGNVTDSRSVVSVLLLSYVHNISYSLAQSSLGLTTPLSILQKYTMSRDSSIAFLGSQEVNKVLSSAFHAHPCYTLLNEHEVMGREKYVGGYLRVNYIHSIL